MLRRTAVIGAVSVVLAGCGAAAAPGRAGEPGRGFSVDHPPLGAYQALVVFTRCMRRHQVLMQEPAPWRGHGRLSIYYPPHDLRTNSAYRACDHFRILAKQQGGPH
jgi:hypothetical protein